MLDPARLQAAYHLVRRRLLEERTAEGHWVGELSSSALSTATAISALCVVSANSGHGDPWRPLIDRGAGWLDAQQNGDGGWGDTDRSHSNIATTMLVRAAYHLAGLAESRGEMLAGAEQYIQQQGGLDALRRRYGRDKTFAVPILSNCAIAGLASWNDVSPLPFELACFPQSMYRFLRMPVVSYAIPALVAIGQARHLALPSRLPWMRWIRRGSVARSLSVLQRMQPASGGYLEATPLTSFVVMNLAASGRADHPVAAAGVRFLLDSARPDGSWPIDTNLATWNTTLALNALSAGGTDVAQLGCLEWLLSCQHRQRHPFTGADPGGWGWTDHSGAVPDADDTPGALLALDAWRRSPNCHPRQRRRIEQAARLGLRWLLALQNRDGGWPTFCRGWGKLPFDRSGADLTAHALRALHAWRDLAPSSAPSKTARGLRYLEGVQRADGSWIPLWFGNQDHPQEENPVYGTAKVMLACRQLRSGLPALARAEAWLRGAQNEDGGWGGGPQTGGVSTIEETALALSALLQQHESSQHHAPRGQVVEEGLTWLMERVEAGQLEPAPIGFYFAKLWYHERLYPLIFATEALARAVRGAHDHSSGDTGRAAAARPASSSAH